MSRKILWAALVAAVMLSPAPAVAEEACPKAFRELLVIDRLIDIAASAADRGDLASFDHMLPMLEQQLAALPSTPTPSLACFDKIYVFDRHRFAELTAAQKAGATSPQGPAAAPFVYSKTVGQLAYLVGWGRFEKKDFAGAIEADRKGLALLPLDHELTRETISALFAAKRFAESETLLEATLADTDLTPKERVLYLDNLTTAQVVTRDYTGAKKSNADALALDGSDDLAQRFAKVLAKK